MTNRNQFIDESNIADPDQILLSIFKTTATTVTQLYKESLNQSTKSYKNGYKQCLLDLMHFASLQQHKRDHTQGNRVALTLDELMEFYNTKQNQINSIDEGSQGLSHSSSMSNDETNNNANDNVLSNNNNNINNVQETNSTVELDNEITTEKNNNNFNNIENGNTEKQNLTEIKTNLGLSKGFTFRFNNDQLSTNFNNINFINNQESLKRRLGGVSNTINFFGKTFNFDNIDTDNEPPFKRNRWRRDDRMTE